MKGNPACLAVTGAGGRPESAVVLGGAWGGEGTVLVRCGERCRIVNSCPDGEVLVSEPRATGVLSRLALLLARSGAGVLVAGALLAVIAIGASFSWSARMARARERDQGLPASGPT